MSEEYNRLKEEYDLIGQQDGETSFKCKDCYSYLTESDLRPL